MLRHCSILSIAPYRLLPPTSGGKLAIVKLHNHIGKLCPDYIVSTTDNDTDTHYAFDMQPILPNSILRYVPFYNYTSILGLARRFDCTSIICEHPYMAPTAALVAKKMGIEWYIRSHNIEAIRFKTLGKKWWRAMYGYEQLAMRKAKGVFFLTEEDAHWAMNNYKLTAAQCHILPFGTDFKQKPEPMPHARQRLATQYKLDINKPWLYFLGALDYAPNKQAVAYILDEIMPRLNKQGKGYQILIAGQGLSEQLAKQIEATDNIIYTGFLDSLDIFLHGCDIMLNPVITGGGIKTKAVEALGYGKQVVSCESGAAGLIKSVCGTNLHISADHEWDAFIKDILKAMNQSSPTPQSFYDTYYWGNIAQKAIGIMTRQ